MAVATPRPASLLLPGPGSRRPRGGQTRGESRLIHGTATTICACCEPGTALGPLQRPTS